MAAASPLRGSIGLGYVSNCGRKDSKIFDKSETQRQMDLLSIILSAQELQETDRNGYECYHIKRSTLG
jgi:hypothetical protein